MVIFDEVLSVDQFFVVQLPSVAIFRRNFKFKNRVINYLKVLIFNMIVCLKNNFLIT